MNAEQQVDRWHEQQVQAWLDITGVWERCSPEDDRDYGKDWTCTHGDVVLSWGFRHRPERQAVSDFTIRYSGKGGTDRFCEYQKLQVGRHPDWYCYYTTNAGRLTDIWVIDMLGFCDSDVLLCPGGRNVNTDGSSFVYYSAEQLTGFLYRLQQWKRPWVPSVVVPSC